MESPVEMPVASQADTATAPRTGRWQFSLAQLLGVTAGLALMLGSALTLLAQRSLVGLGVYMALNALAVGVIMASVLRQPWRAIVGALCGSVIGVPLYAVLAVLSMQIGNDNVTSRMTSPAMLVYFFAITLLTAVPGSLAAGRTEYREIAWWRWICILIGLTFGFGLTGMAGFRSGDDILVMRAFLAITKVVIPTVAGYHLAFWFGFVCWVSGCGAIACGEVFSTCWPKSRKTPRRSRTSYRRRW